MKKVFSILIIAIMFVNMSSNFVDNKNVEVLSVCDELTYEFIQYVDDNSDVSISELSCISNVFYAKCTGWGLSASYSDCF